MRRRVGTVVGREEWTRERERGRKSREVWGALKESEFGNGRGKWF